MSDGERTHSRGVETTWNPDGTETEREICWSCQYTVIDEDGHRVRRFETWPCEVTRLRERVAELDGAVTAYKAAYDAASVVWDQEDDPDGWRDRMDAAHLAVENAQGALFAALVGQEQAS